MSGSESALSELTTLWTESYQGEVLGEAFFARMRDLYGGPGQEAERGKLDHLVRLERSTREMLAPYLERHGICAAPDPRLEGGMAALQRQEWRPLLEGVRAVAASYLAKYRRLAELVASEDRVATDALVAHEQALDEFCRRELEGDAERSLEPIQALAHFR